MANFEMTRTNQTSPMNKTIRGFSTNSKAKKENTEVRVASNEVGSHSETIRMCYLREFSHGTMLSSSGSLQ